MATCAQFQHWWETCTTTAALRVYLHQTHLVIIYFHWTCGGMCSVSSLPGELIPVWNLHDCKCFESIYLSLKQNCLYWETHSCCSGGDIHCHETHTGNKPAHLQVLSGFIYPKPQLLVMANTCPLVLWWLPLGFCSAMRTYVVENPEQLQVLSECTYPTNIIVCNAKLMPTILMVTCAQGLYCQESTYWWETCTTTYALRMFPSCKHWL